MKRGFLGGVAALSVIACVHVEASPPVGAHPSSVKAHAEHGSGASPAGAMSMGGGKMMDMATGEAMACPAGRLASADRLDALRASLELSPDQETAFREFVQAIGEFRMMRHEGMMTMAERSKMSLPQRLLAHEHMMDDHLLRLKSLRRASEIFYERLTPDQRSKAEALVCGGGHQG